MSRRSEQRDAEKRVTQAQQEENGQDGEIGEPKVRTTVTAGANFFRHEGGRRKPPYCNQKPPHAAPLGGKKRGPKQDGSNRSPSDLYFSARPFFPGYPL